MNFKINLKNEIIDLLKIYNSYSFEVGGMIFGRKIFNTYFLKTLSLKKGESMHIDFSYKDKIIYELPEGQKNLGTWHLHPMQSEAIPSSTDLKQWEKWKKNYIHIICTKKEFKIFNSKGECLYEYSLEEM